MSMDMSLKHYESLMPRRSEHCYSDGKVRYKCPVCGLAFQPQGLAGHMYGKHGYRTGIRADIAALAQRLEEVEGIVNRIIPLAQRQRVKDGDTYIECCPVMLRVKGKEAE